MKKKIIYKGAETVYNDTGSGEVLFFLHGYLETKEIWSDFALLFEKKFRIITLDIPGHGASEVWGKVHTMDDIASLVLYIIDHEKIDKIYLIGHSMGGYITLAFAELYRERLKGYCLFHSTCFSDPDEKKLNREREISLVRCGKKNQIINVNIPKGFANENLGRLQEKVKKAKEIARSCEDDGIVALLNGMMERPDRTHVLARADLPVLLIGGLKDNYISGEGYKSLADKAPHATFVFLKKSGHMGFIEEPGPSEEAVLEWTGYKKRPG